MASRHLSRSIALQTLFEWDFNGYKDEDVKQILEKNVAEFGPGMEADVFMNDLVNAVKEKRVILDEIIEKAAPEWPIEKINGIDRNILRLGLAELLFGDRENVPPKVAINEAIELAKAFGGENSSRFINGVLGAVYKEIGEPGKDQVSKKKNDEPIDISKLPIEQLGGAVVYAIYKGEPYLAMVHDVFGYWTLSKGKIEAGENPVSGMIREIKEEIGIDVEVEEKLGENEYIASHPEKGKLRKHVHYFLVRAEYQELKLESSGGLDNAKWFSFAEVAPLRMYDDIVVLITRSIEIISRKESLNKD